MTLLDMVSGYDQIEVAHEDRYVWIVLDAEDVMYNLDDVIPFYSSFEEH